MDTHSRTPWSAYGKWIKDASGKPIGLIEDARDLDFAIRAANDYSELERRCSELEGSDERLDEVLDAIEGLRQKLEKEDVPKQEIIDVLENLLGV